MADSVVGLVVPLRAFCVGCGQMATFGVESAGSGSMVCEREACPEFGKTVYFDVWTGVIERVEERKVEEVAKPDEFPRGVVSDPDSPTGWRPL
jgi:hypothetical protein